LDLDVDIVIEASGALKHREAAIRHLDAGADRVVVTAAPEGAEPTLCFGGNEHEFYPEIHHIVFCASSTTNCVAPVAKALDEKIGIETGTFTALGASSYPDSMMDLSWADRRPEDHGAKPGARMTPDVAQAVADVLPDLSGKLYGYGIPVPGENVAMVDFVIHSEQPATRESIERAIQSHAKRPELENVLKIHDGDLPPSDIRGTPYSAVIESGSTAVVRGHTVKILARYDAERAFVSRVIDLTEHIAETVDRYRSETRDQVIQAAP
jgi:glyceraldehyde 3-phosphate dehydrogenase